jgi:endoglucanase
MVRFCPLRSLASLVVGIAVGLFAAGVPLAIGSADPAAEVDPKAPVKPAAGIAGNLTVPAVWEAWKRRFIEPDGRVIDDANGKISHSEGQGYAMLLAVAAADRPTFDRVWAWTRRNLMIREDGLAAWKWDPQARPPVTDRNNATDGDILIAWALAEAAEAWGDVAHRSAARRIVRALAPTRLTHDGLDGLLLPGLAGFGAADRSDGPVINPSYFVFPAFERLAAIAPDAGWRDTARAGLTFVADARFGPRHLTAEWVALGGEALAPAEGFPAHFGYNAIRVPLYLAWSHEWRRAHLAPYAALWGEQAPSVVDLTTGTTVEPLSNPGYGAVAALVACALEGTKLADRFKAPADEPYYPATLHALALVAVHQRYPECW